VTDKEYGGENSGYVSLTSYVEDALFPPGHGCMVVGSLAMFLTAWETIIGAKVAAKLLSMPAGELAVSVAAIRRRLAKMKEILRTTI
jgi:hypothetical protein